MSAPRPERVTPGLLRSWPLSEAGSDKRSRGYLLVLGGSRTTPGAVLLAGSAALRAGAGKLAIGTSQSVSPALAVAVPEARVIDLPEARDGSIAPTAADPVVDAAQRVDALLAGPGLEDPEAAVALLSAVIPRLACPLVLDALGTAYLTDNPDGVTHLEGRVVVTANPTELARMLGRDEEETAERPLEAAREISRRCRAVVLAGASDKYVAAPDGRSWVVDDGGPGLGVSGSGDVQAGLVAGLLARGEDPEKAAVWGAYLHARAGERLGGLVGRLGYLARELPAVVPTLLEEIG